MASEIKVSVVMAAYNAEQYLRQAISCLTHQTLQEIELILVDDGSTDGTLTIMQEYAARDGRVRVLRQERETPGAGAARNLGIAEAKGEYLSILDADDVFQRQMLERAYARALETDADVVMFDGEILEDARQEIRAVDWILRQQYVPGAEVFDPADYADSIYHISVGTVWNLLLRRKLVQGKSLQFEELANTDDITFTYLAISTARRMTVLNERLIAYRRKAGTMSVSCESNPLCGWEAWKRLRQHLIEQELYETYKVSYVSQALSDLLPSYLGQMKHDWPTFQRMYEALQEHYLADMDIESISDDQLAEDAWIDMRRHLLTLSAEEFYADVYGRSFPPAPNGAKVVLYGAGDQGQRLFQRIMHGHEWELVCWVDRDYEKLGYPIEAPETILEHEFDYVFIAIENTQACQQVKNFLVGLGIPPEKLMHAVRGGQGIAVSVIMPVKDTMPYFAKALDSVRAQTLKNLEIIVVDAHSTDGTREFIQQRMAEDSRIRMLDQDKKSLGYAYNIGIAAARGEYIGFCEADDFLLPDMMGKLYWTAKEHDLEYVKADFSMFVSSLAGELRVDNVYSLGDMEIYGKVIDTRDYPDLLLRDGFMWRGIYRRDFLARNRVYLNESPGAAYQDNGFLHQTIINGRRVMYTADSFYQYRIDNENSSVYNPRGLEYVSWEYDYLEEKMLDYPERFPAFHYVFYRKLLQQMRWNASHLPFESIPPQLLDKFRGYLSRGMAAGCYSMAKNKSEMLEVESFLADPAAYCRRSYEGMKAQKQHVREFLLSLRQQRLVIAGCNEGSVCLMCIILRYGLAKLEGICDASPQRRGRLLNGLRVESLEEAARQHMGAVFVIATNPREAENLQNQLLGVGISDLKIRSLKEKVTPRMVSLLELEEV